MPNEYWLSAILGPSIEDLELAPFSYTGLKEFLLPALEAAWELENTLRQLREWLRAAIFTRASSMVAT